jgi:hypothetical protein
MKAADVHALLLTCPAPVRAVREFGEAVSGGSIAGTATIIYNRDKQVHEGKNAKLQRYWRRIEAAAEQASVWTTASANLPEAGQAEAVQLTAIDFEDAAVEAFIQSQKPPKPRRGKTRVQDDWAPLWIAAAKLAKAGQLNIGTFPHSTDLIERLHTLMGATFDEQTIKPFVSQIYNQVAKKTPAQLEDELNLTKTDAD